MFENCLLHNSACFMIHFLLQVAWDSACGAGLERAPILAQRLSTPSFSGCKFSISAASSWKWLGGLAVALTCMHGNDGSSGNLKHLVELRHDCLRCTIYNVSCEFISMHHQRGGSWLIWVVEMRCCSLTSSCSRLPLSRTSTQNSSSPEYWFFLEIAEKKVGGESKGSSYYLNLKLIVFSHICSTEEKSWPDWNLRGIPSRLPQFFSLEKKLKHC